MSNWFFSLRFRMIVAFALVLALALGSASIYVGYAAQREAERFQEEVEESRAARVEQLVSGQYSDRWDRPGLQAALEQAAELYNVRIVVEDPSGSVVGDSHMGSGMMTPVRLYGTRVRFGDVFSNSGQRVGTLQVSFQPLPELPPEPSFFRLASAMKMSLLWAGLAAGAGGILLISLVSRQVLAPVMVLTSAARRLGQGDLSQRVSTSSRDEVGQLGRTFNSMAEGLERAEEQRRSLMADVAHELRTPLSNVQGYLEAVRDGLLEPDTETIDTIHQQVLHLSHLVEDLRLLALAEAGALSLDLEPDSLVELLRMSIEAVRPRAEARGVSLSLDVSSEFPLVEMDRTRIAQVVGNLLENAIIHTPDGGDVTVVAEVVGVATARVTVADTGEGIPQEDLAHVFERFYRADPSRSRATGGVGLGLTIARQLVEAHGGTIHAESAPGKGSRFIFEIPLSGNSATA